MCTRTAVSVARPQNDGLAEAGSNEAKSVSWHSGPERGFQPDRAGLRVLQGWRRSELLASQVLYEGVTHDPVPTFDGSQLLRNSSYISKKRYVSSLSEPEAGLVRIVHDPQCAACRQSRQIQESFVIPFGAIVFGAIPKPPYPWRRRTGDCKH